MPVSTPVVGSIVPTVVGVALHEPPAVELVRVIVEPAHTDDGPTIGVPVATTFIVVVTEQPATR